jgi:HMG box factor
VTVEQAGVEALLQLGLQPEEDDLSSGLGSPSKRQRLNPSISPPVSGPLLPPGLYDSQFTHAPDPNIDPYFRQGSIEHDSPTTSLEHEGSSQSLPQFNTAQISADVFSIKAMPILKKIRALNRICPPISSPAVPPFNTFATTRMPIISLDGDDVDVVGELFHAVAQELEKTESVHLIDEPDELTVLSEAYLEGLLSSAGLEKDKEADDADAARYLSHVAFWRRKAAGIRRVVTTGCASADREDAGQEEVFPRGTPQLVLINRYILSRSDAAALRLSTDGLSPLEHWQWCASLWRSCVGCDMTIYVQTLPEGSMVGSDAVESKDDGKVLLARKSAGGKEWGEKVVRRLGFEIGEMVRSLRGFPV